MKSLFKLGEDLTKLQSYILTSIGFVFIILIWQAVVQFGGIPNSVFPSPFKVLTAIPELYNNYNQLFFVYVLYVMLF